MRVNSINTIQSIYNAKPSFKHTAVPYPEYSNAYLPEKTFSEKLADTFKKLFNPQVSKEAENIKNQIDACYDDTTECDDPKKCLLSVLA